MARPSPARGAAEPVRPTPRQIAAVSLAVFWLVAFGVYFFDRWLPNNPSWHRLDLLMLVPELLLRNFVEDSGETFPAGWRYAPQRLDLVGTAAVVLAGAWGLGRSLLRLIDRSTDALQLDDLGRIERAALAFGLGLSAWSLLTLGFGLAGWLSRPLFVGTAIAAAAGGAVVSIRDRGSRRQPTRPDRHGSPRGWAPVLCMAASVPFLLAAALGAMLPPLDFDVKEYHLGGPKEWYLDGAVRFLPHNVYTSFPFLTEMLSLSAMAVRGDWYRGALAGQLVLAAMYPLAAAAVYAAGRRLFSPLAGLIAALIYISTPWAFRISVIAYAEGGLTAFLALTLLASVLGIERLRAGRPAGGWTFLAGVFAGSAMACKYPGVIQIVIPAGAALLAANLGRFFRESSARTDPLGHDDGGKHQVARSGGTVIAIYAAGVVLAVGPWLTKNLVETGNPVYPLLYTVFGGRDWDAELNAKWKAAHSPPDHAPAAFVQGLAEIAAVSDWQSVLVFGLAPLAFLRRPAGPALALGLLLAYLYVTWWALTHRIDRFWVPLLPVACLLAGAGATWVASPARLTSPPLPDAARRAWFLACGVFLALGVVFNLSLVTTTLGGSPTRFLTDYAFAADQLTSPGLAALERVLPPDAKVLLVGEAAIFDARFPVLYNTVFDRSLFEDWTAEPRPGVPKQEWPLRPVADVRRTFAENGVTHVAVNWREVLRYRTTYGFTDYVTPERFEQLRRAGLLAAPVTLAVTPAESLSADVIAEAEKSYPTLFQGAGKTRTLVTEQVYPVVAE